MVQLTDRGIKNLAPPASGNRIHYDDQVNGFGLRITAAGAKAFILNFRIAGRERRMTLGSYPAWTLVRARERAKELRRMIDNGVDPLGEREDSRKAPTVADLVQRFADEHLARLRETTANEYRSIIRTYVLPELKHRKVADVSYSDIDALHRKITRGGARYRANRAVAIMSKMFALAIRWKWRSDNPCIGIERNQEMKRHRYLSADELARLSVALAEHDDRQAANIVRLLLLTGARRGEVQGMQWAHIDLERGVWTKPGATTKQKTEHRVPLSEASWQLLRAIHAAAMESRNNLASVYVFPSIGASGHRVEIKQNWARLCKAAGIESARLHDLRHTYASVLASAGLGLPVIGALLGHSQPQTTARYAHLFDDPLRAATEKASAAINGTGA
jgi:integrase